MAALFTIEQAVIAPQVLIATGSSALLASGNNAISGAIDLTQATPGVSKGYSRGRISFSGVFSGTPAVNSSIAVYLDLSTDGTSTNFETDLGRSTTPVREALCVIPLDTTNTTQNRVSATVDLPAIPAKFIFVNNGSGQNIAAGWSASLLPVTDAGF